MTRGWLQGERTEVAAERILDAAARLFAARGVADVGMGEVAREAGCSRATLYRYFDSRAALRLAFVHRAARRVGALVAAEVSGIAEPDRLVTAAMLAAVREVRRDPSLVAWFRPGEAGYAGQIGQSSDVIESLTAGFLPDGLTADDPDRLRLARWLTRIIVSLLTVPDPDERLTLETFVAPVLRSRLATLAATGSDSE
jgi:AcrR family transcriptional regulator